MRDQVGVSRPQHQEYLAGRELDPRTFLDAEQIVGAQLAADEQLLARPQHLQVAAPLAIDENYGVVFFQARVQGDSTLARIARAGNTRRAIHSIEYERRVGLLTTRPRDLTFEDAPGQMVASNGRVV